ncbi:hypothetical protein [Sorangium sp. So ce233]|uniref:hypothetical protein n=1 Tax=Sorangium sp. So ce233 TaxID=3133290 RepID=UPI003F63D180
MADAARRWSGPTRPAAPGWRAALAEPEGDAVRLRIVAIAAWGLGGPANDVPLAEDGTRLDGPELRETAPPGTADAELWRRLHGAALPRSRG